MSELIVVRDRRQPLQFSVANVVIDEWLPIIGTTGYALYSLYVRMARIDDERCWPGYQMTAQHLGISKGSISNYNRLLSWCRLIHIEPGDRQHANTYYVLAVPEVTAERMIEIRRRAEGELSPGSSFQRTVYDRLDQWEPIQALWGQSSQPLQVVRPGQLVLPGIIEEEGSSPVEQGSTLVEQGVQPAYRNNPNKQSKGTIQRNNPNNNSSPPERALSPGDSVDAAVVDELAELGIDEPVRSQVARLEGVDVHRVRAWGLYSETQSLTNRAGFVVSRLQKGYTPPGEFQALAHVGEEDWAWMEDHAKARAWTGEWPPGLPIGEDLAAVWWEWFGEDEGS